jgi:hypothetical protein
MWAQGGLSVLHITEVPVDFGDYLQDTLPQVQTSSDVILFGISKD